ncbi:hypothetical protein GA0115242_12118, partial [Streptomyces sp. SolWspMP-5a-2]
PPPPAPGAAPRLPRRVPQTSLAAELREDVPAEQGSWAEEFTAERAAASLGGFQRGTFQARDEDDEDIDPEPGTPVTPAGTPVPWTPPADR